MKWILWTGLACSLLGLSAGCCVVGEIYDSPVLPRNRGSFEHCGPAHAARCAAPCDTGADCGEPCGTACDTPCGEPCPHRHWGPVSWIFSMFDCNAYHGPNYVGRGHGYWGEIDHCDPCDDCGNFTGGSDCGCGGGEPVGYRSRGTSSGSPQVISETDEEVAAQPRRAAPVARSAEPRRAAQSQRAYNR